MQKPHWMQLPREVLIGYNVLDKLPEVLLKLDISGSILLLTGKKTRDIAGEHVRSILSSEGYDVNLMIVNKATIDEINRITENSGKSYSAILGVGGGKVIDVAKIVSKNKNRPYISVPTTASHDGIASPRASIKGFAKRHSIQASAPLAILTDTKIIMKSPYRLLASGCADLISNATAVFDWRLAHKKTGEYFGEYSAALSELCANLIIDNAEIIPRKEEESVRLVLESLISSGVAMAIAGSSRPASGGEHLFSHSLDMIAKKPALHGEQCGVGAIIMSYLQKMDWKKIKDSLRIIGAPTNARELGVDDNEVIEALLYAPKIRPERYTILNEVKLDRKKAEKVLLETGIITGL